MIQFCVQSRSLIVFAMSILQALATRKAAKTVTFRTWLADVTFDMLNVYAEVGLKQGSARDKTASQQGNQSLSYCCQIVALRSCQIDAARRAREGHARSSHDVDSANYECLGRTIQLDFVDTGLHQGMKRKLPSSLQSS